MSFIKEYFGDVIGGGKMEETTLWTNPDPSINFTAQAVTLSDDINNYDFLKVTYAFYKTNLNKTAEVIYSIDEVKKLAAAAGNFKGATAFYNSGSTGTVYSRSFSYTSNTELYFYNMQQINGTGSDNGNGIPLKISGMKLVKGPANVKIGSFDVTADNQEVTVNVGFKPKQIAIVFQGNSGSSTAAANGCVRVIYDERIADNVCHRGIINPSGTAAVGSAFLDTANVVRISEVNDNGFKYKNDSTGTGWRGTYYYFAIG